MKKLLAIALTLVLLFTLAACGSGDNGNDTDPGDSNPGSNNGGDTNPGSGSNNNTDPGDDNQSGGDDGFELALITDLGTIDDGSFNQGSWEGLKQYADEHNITYKYYQPAAQGDDAYLNAIDLAVQGGAKVIVTPGYLFEVPIFVAQDLYPDVRFILLDGDPHAGDYNPVIGANTVSVHYAEEQSGFLAGYAAVKDGYRKLGYMGGISVPPVIRYGIGFIEGAEYAAQELGLDDGSVSINYNYTMTFEPSADIQTMAASWYNDGVEVIFACGGGIFFSIAPAAETAGKKVIGVDTDQSGLSDTVITSALKLLTKSVYDCIADFYKGDFKGGQTLIFAADNLGVGLPMSASKFESFSQADYDAIFAQLVSKAIVPESDIGVEPDAIPVKAVSLNYIK